MPSAAVVLGAEAGSAGRCTWHPQGGEPIAAPHPAPLEAAKRIAGPLAGMGAGVSEGRRSQQLQRCDRFTAQQDRSDSAEEARTSPADESPAITARAIQPSRSWRVVGNIDGFRSIHLGATDI